MSARLHAYFCAKRSRLSLHDIRNMDRELVGEGTFAKVWRDGDECIKAFDGEDYADFEKELGIYYILGARDASVKDKWSRHVVSYRDAGFVDVWNCDDEDHDGSKTHNEHCMPRITFLPIIRLEYIPIEVEKRAYSAVKCLNILTDLLHGLSFLHSKGIVHADVKPSNLRFRKDGSLVICDLGAAQRVSETKRGGVMTLGTTEYCAPEMLLELPFDTSADIFSTAVTMYYLFTGKYPFQTHREGPEECTASYDTERLRNSNLRQLQLISAYLGEIPDELTKPMNSVAFKHYFDPFCNIIGSVVRPGTYQLFTEGVWQNCPKVLRDFISEGLSYVASKRPSSEKMKKTIRMAKKHSTSSDQLSDI